jgi:hypothetical protein
MATGRNRGIHEKGRTRRIRSRSQPTATPRALMVRRGSTVRVRQRALQKPRTQGLSFSSRVAGRPTWATYGALYGASRSRRRPRVAAIWNGAGRVVGSGYLARARCSFASIGPKLTARPRRAVSEPQSLPSPAAHVARVRADRAGRGQEENDVEVCVQPNRRISLVDRGRLPGDWTGERSAAG